MEMECIAGSAGGFKKSLQNMSPKLTKLIRHFALQYPSATFL